MTKVQATLRDPNTGELDTLPATTFTWSDGDWAYSDIDTATLGISGTTIPDLTAFGDVNGDGRDDYVEMRSGGKIYVSLSGGSSLGSATLWATSPAAVQSSIRLCDVNGDGRKDVLFSDRNESTPSPTQKLYVLVANTAGTAFVPLSGTTASPIYTTSDEWKDPGFATYNFLTQERTGVWNRTTAADFDGDGRDDILIHRYDGKLKLLLSTGTDSQRRPRKMSGLGKLMALRCGNLSR
ncbi:MAG: VCBS repeat-containing protein [Opitutus sp.]|nr:VCBS repeat-containing protein [Opitutus sp.]